MSRTKRLKNVPNTYINHGLWGYFAAWLSDSGDHRTRIDKISHPDLWYADVRRMHSESSHANERTPNKIYRRNREIEYRQMAKHEIFKFTVDREYEVMIHDKPKTHMWDWR